MVQMAPVARSHVLNTVRVCMFTAEEEKCCQSTAMCHCWYQYTVMLALALCLFLFSSCDEIKVKRKEEHVKYIMCCLEFRVSIQFTLLLQPQEVENPALNSARSFLNPVLDGRMIWVVHIQMNMNFKTTKTWKRQLAVSVMKARQFVELSRGQNRLKQPKICRWCKMGINTVKINRLSFSGLLELNTK